MTIDLEFDVNAVCVAEMLLDKKAPAIIAELESEDGVSLRTLRALVAAGRLYTNPLAKLGGVTPSMADEGAAGKLIDEAGITAASAIVGEKLGQFFRQLSEERSAA